jgi:hypothetical protein
MAFQPGTGNKSTTQKEIDNEFKVIQYSSYHTLGYQDLLLKIVEIEDLQCPCSNRDHNQ